MNRRSAVLMQSLESRRLLSGTLPGTDSHPGITPFADDPTIQADLAQLRDDTRQFHKDRRSTTQTLRDDHEAIETELQALKESDSNLETELQPVKDQLRADIKARNKALRADYQALEDGTADERETVHQDIIQLRKDRAAGDDTAVTADKAKLTTDRQALADAAKPFQDTIKADRSKWKTTINADHDAIQAKLESLDSKLTPLFDQLAADETAAKTKLDADRAAIKADLDKLHEDIDALKNASGSGS